LAEVELAGGVEADFGCLWLDVDLVPAGDLVDFLGLVWMLVDVLLVELGAVDLADRQTWPGGRLAATLGAHGGDKRGHDAHELQTHTSRSEQRSGPKISNGKPSNHPGERS
jgi:hypothetical protein